jgi:rRNA maturation endonuclease Nob1
MSGTAERYVRAARSSDLKMEPEPKDVDVVISAGMADRLGTLLMRCQQEWDSQRGEFERMYTTLQINRTNAESIAKRKAKNDAEADRFAAEAAKGFEDAKVALSTSRALAMMAMGSLPRAYVEMQNYAIVRVARRRLELQPEDIADIVGNMLDVWLDQRCDNCNGTRETGVYGGPRAICKPCGGSGVKRRAIRIKSSDANVLTDWLLIEADRLVEKARRRMRQKLR